MPCIRCRNSKVASLREGSPAQIRFRETKCPCDPIREAAVRFLRVHPLRAADALQLAAAFIAAGCRPSSLEVVTLDDRLAGAARKGIRVDRRAIDRIVAPVESAPTTVEPVSGSTADRHEVRYVPAPVYLNSRTAPGLTSCCVSEPDGPTVRPDRKSVV